MAFVDSEGIQIYFDDTGEGEPALLCLPGFMNDHTIFAPLVERLGADHRVLVMDWRGHGKSQASDRDFGFAKMAGDAVAVIEDSGAHSVIPYAQGQLPWVAVEVRRRLGERVPKMVASSWPVISVRGNPARAPVAGRADGRMARPCPHPGTGRCQGGSHLEIVPSV